MICTQKLNKEPAIHENFSGEHVEIGQWTEIGPNNIWENVKFGDFSYTSGNNQIQNARIGNFVNIASGVRIGPPQHPMNRPTLHHFTYRRQIYGFAMEDDTAFFAWRTAQITEVGHDVWLGHNAIIMPGVKIGNGAIVGSSAVVTKDVAPFTIVGGVPAKVIRKRFSADVIEKLQRIKWWNWTYETIKELFPDFLLSVEDFVHKYDRE
ncbi:MAG: chloramphenicol acetyltransferase [Clostridiaceae bacterium BRH_c20a]|nr:MAG: chloramphenicol acetyltransferase [Clostridiaceae bacterium BRH_c20a]